MSLSIVIDMNLSRDWIATFASEGWKAVHWSDIGDPRAKDSAILDWAVANGHLVFSHDLDFSTELALSRATAPSLVQLRSYQTLPARLAGAVVSAIKRFEAELQAGALVTINPGGNRARLLPL